MVRYLVTSALPYANGPIHFGHVAGAYLPADVYVRTLRMQGEDVRFICGADEHGVAITINAEREGLPYADYVARWRGEIKDLFDRLDITFDVWSGTSISPHHEELSQGFFRSLLAAGYILDQESEQLFCVTDDMFLADRYVLGTCPECGREDARGDECPGCGTWLDPLKLIEPRCKTCGTRPERRSTKHWYLDLPKLRDAGLGSWVDGHEWKPNVAAFLANMMKDTRPRAITRDMKWGIPVPADCTEGAEGKVLYVWFDAPIGYISFTKEWAEKEGRPEAWKDYWQSSDTRLVHFIGKDNIAFHAMVFPAMLFGVEEDYVLPWSVPANEFYNLQGRKFSTSENWRIDLGEFFERYDPDVTRFYLLSSLPETADSEWRWEDFQRCVNASLADTIGNLATRVLRFIDKHHEGRIPESSSESELDLILLSGCGAIEDPAESVRAFRFRRAAETLVANAACGNVFVDRMAPWKLKREDPELAGAVLNTLCEWLALTAQWMAPFLPTQAQKLWAMLGQGGRVEDEGWPGVPQAGRWRRLQAGQPLGEVAALFAKIEDATVEAEIRALGERADS